MVPCLIAATFGSEDAAEIHDSSVVFVFKHTPESAPMVEGDFFQDANFTARVRPQGDAGAILLKDDARWTLATAIS
jgi:hypothetical protein